MMRMLYPNNRTPPTPTLPSHNPPPNPTPTTPQHPPPHPHPQPPQPNPQPHPHHAAPLHIWPVVLKTFPCHDISMCYQLMIWKKTLHFHVYKLIYSPSDHRSCCGTKLNNSTYIHILTIVRRHWHLISLSTIHDWEMCIIIGIEA